MARLRQKGRQQARTRFTPNWSAVTSLITALTALGALVFTGVSVNIARHENELAAQGQITDRYSRAVEQIGQQGTDHLQIRLGGIYALERLAHDSTRDQPTILAVLSAFVRTTAPAKVMMPSGLDCPNQPVSPDVQAALTVIGRRDTNLDLGTRVDLRDACLRHAQLSSANLSNADLAGTTLGSANLIDTRLDRAYLVQANLSGANLTGANLSHTNLKYANLGYADLDSASLSNANLKGAHLRFANLRSADLSGANVESADLSDADHNDATSVAAVVKNEATQGAWW